MKVPILVQICRMKRPISEDDDGKSLCAPFAVPRVSSPQVVECGEIAAKRPRVALASAGPHDIITPFGKSGTEERVALHAANYAHQRAANHPDHYFDLVDRR